MFSQPSEITVSDALAFLPLPHDEPRTNLSDFDDSDVKIDKKDDKSKSKFDHNIASALRILGFQNLLFLVNALLLEEVSLMAHLFLLAFLL